jgi:hypothetical protein
MVCVWALNGAGLAFLHRLQTPNDWELSPLLIKKEIRDNVSVWMTWGGH